MDDESADRLIEYLMGSTYSVEDAVEMLEMDIDPADALDEIINTIDVCLGCSRWHELHDLEGVHDLYCSDCIQHLDK